MSKEAVEQAKQLFDKELDAAYAETIKRWKLSMAESGLGKVARVLKGGVGSGNWGHSGRPGKVGGSTPLSLNALAATPTLKALLKQSAQSTDSGLVDSGPVVRKVFNELGYDRKPTIVSDLDSVITSGDEELYRGVSGVTTEQTSKYVYDFKQGDLFIGGGLYGSGTYTGYGSDAKELALGYTGINGNTGLIRMALDKNAKVIDIDNLRRNIAKIDESSDARRNAVIKAAFKAHAEGNTTKSDALLSKSANVSKRGNALYKAIDGDYAIAAAAMGYDAIRTGRGSVVILNRSKVKVEL